jgi:glycosyltransferase involved in cell wall biosynthesis
MKKPIFAISPKNGATSRIVSEEGLGEIADPDDVEEIVAALERLYSRWKHREPLGPGYEASYRKYNVQCLTEQLASLLPS